MIVSWNWLTDYLRLDMSVETLTERLALSGLNLEGFSDVGGDIAIDLEVTSNRPDCLCHAGVGRARRGHDRRDRRGPRTLPTIHGAGGQRGPGRREPLVDEEAARDDRR